MKRKLGEEEGSLLLQTKEERQQACGQNKLRGVKIHRATFRVRIEVLFCQALFDHGKERKDSCAKDEKQAFVMC